MEYAFECASDKLSSEPPSDICCHPFDLPSKRTRNKFNVPVEVLLDAFSFLSRRILERQVKLVNRRFRDILLKSNRRPCHLIPLINFTNRAFVEVNNFPVGLSVYKSTLNCYVPAYLRVRSVTVAVVGPFYGSQTIELRQTIFDDNNRACLLDNIKSAFYDETHFTLSAILVDQNQRLSDQLIDIVPFVLERIAFTSNIHVTLPPQTVHDQMTMKVRRKMKNDLSLFHFPTVRACRRFTVNNPNWDLDFEDLDDIIGWLHSYSGVRKVADRMLEISCSFNSDDVLKELKNRILEKFLSNVDDDAQNVYQFSLLAIDSAKSAPSSLSGVQSMRHYNAKKEWLSICDNVNRLFIRRSLLGLSKAKD